MTETPQKMVQIYAGPWPIVLDKVGFSGVDDVIELTDDEMKTRRIQTPALPVYSPVSPSYEQVTLPIQVQEVLEIVEQPISLQVISAKLQVFTTMKQFEDLQKWMNRVEELARAHGIGLRFTLDKGSRTVQHSMDFKPEAAS